MVQLRWPVWVKMQCFEQGCVQSAVWGMHHLSQASPYILLLIELNFRCVMPYVPLSVWHAPCPAPAVSAACARDPIGAFNLFVQGSVAQAGVSAQQPLEAASCCG